MLQPQREGAEERRAGPSRSAVWGWKHFEVKDQLRGLITHLCCHSHQPPDLNEQISKAEPGSSFPTPLLLIAWSASCTFPHVLQQFGDVGSFWWCYTKNSVTLSCTSWTVWRIRTCVCLQNATCRTQSNLPEFPGLTEHQTREKRCCWNPDPLTPDPPVYLYRKWLGSEPIFSLWKAEIEKENRLQTSRSASPTKRPLSEKRQTMRCNIHHPLYVFCRPVIFYTFRVKMLRSESITCEECLRPSVLGAELCSTNWQTSHLGSFILFYFLSGGRKAAAGRAESESELGCSAP